jgi:pimeloyl-ACP methyl ester carboxylesterase
MGRVSVLRGFGDVFSVGMDKISTKLQEQGVISTVHHHDQWQEIAEQIIRERRSQDFPRSFYAVPPSVLVPPEPLVLIGHSWGAVDCVRIARKLAEYDIPVDLLVTVEAVTPPAVPGNVLRAWNIYKPGPMDFLPWWRGVPLHADSTDRPRLTQIDIPRDWPAVDHWWLGHSDVENQPAVQDRIVDLVLSACPAKDVPDAR